MDLVREVLEDLRNSYNVELVVLLDSGGRELWRIGPERPFSTSAVEKSMKGKAPVVFSDILHNGKPETGVFYRLQSIVVVPLDIEGKISGYLYFDSGTKRCFSEGEIGELKAFGKQS